MGNNVETEIKLLVAKKDLKTLLSSDLVVKKVKKGSHKTLKLTNAYYDTEELCCSKGVSPTVFGRKEKCLKLPLS